MQPGDTEEDRKIVIYHEEWCSMNVDAIEVIEPIDMSKRYVSRVILSVNGEERLEPGQKFVAISNQQIWLTDKKGELEEMVTDKTLIRKLTESETEVIIGGLESNGIPVKELLNIFDSGKYKENEPS